MNILAVAAHPDDVEYGCGGTLLKYKKQGHSIFIAYTTSGNTGSNTMNDPFVIATTREAEAMRAAEIYDARVRFLRNNDERLPDTDETRSQVLDAMRWANPDVIFTHSSTDESPDHATTSKLVRSMMLSLPGRNQRAQLPPITKKPTLFLWETDNGVDYLPTIYVDISEELEDKLKALACFDSQEDWMDVFGADLGGDVRIMAEMRGMQYGCKYAECFTPFMIHGYMPNYKLLP